MVKKCAEYLSCSHLPLVLDVYNPAESQQTCFLSFREFYIFMTFLYGTLLYLNKHTVALFRQIINVVVQVVTVPKVYF